MKKRPILTALLTIAASGWLLAGAAAEPDAAAGKAKAALCAGCHGFDGNGVAPNYPKLAGLGQGYLAQQMRDYQSGARNGPIMLPMAQMLNGQEIEDVAAWFAAQKAAGAAGSTVGAAEKTPDAAPADERLERGAQLYAGGDATRGIPACIACHAPNGVGNGPARFPALAGQYAPYSVDQLKKFRSGERANDPNRMMRDIAARLSDADIDALAAYAATLR